MIEAPPLLAQKHAFHFALQMPALGEVDMAIARSYTVFAACAADRLALQRVWGQDTLVNG